ncbi:unnamed protein product [Ambrosiozyma monospora]|uniref:Unnamed protein product n=1 Tax=Ambrosiozyma monospora TaxID=43982 RepID=A0ACB5TDS2_AMBMO|nr:unnamed protein product [Ambrosiozyma monospora]
MVYTPSLAPLTATATVSVPAYETITSILNSAATHLATLTPQLATATEQATTRSLQQVVINEMATMSYYSILEELATATDPELIATLQPQAAQASAVAKEVFDNSAFFHGNYPSLGGNAALLTIFIIFLICHVVFSGMTKQWWFGTCWVMGLILEVIGYGGRVAAHYTVTEFNPYVIQLVCLTIAPSFLLAGIYYTLAQLTVVMGPKFSMLKPMQYSSVFILFDLIAIIIQAVGGASAALNLSDFTSSRPGANIMVGGLAFQVFSMSLFQFFWYNFLWRCYKERKYNGGAGFNPDYDQIRQGKYFIHLLVAISAAVLLIYVRSIYRLIELCEGFAGTLATVEIYFMILEALMTALASLILTVVYPRFVYGRKSCIVVKKGINLKFGKKKCMKCTGKNVEEDDSSDDNNNSGSVSTYNTVNDVGANGNKNGYPVLSNVEGNKNSDNRGSTLDEKNSNNAV